MQTVSSMNKTWLQCSREAAQFPCPCLPSLDVSHKCFQIFFFFHALQPKQSHLEPSNELNPPDTSYFHICTPPPLNENKIKIPLPKVRRGMLTETLKCSPVKLGPNRWRMLEQWHRMTPKSQELEILALEVIGQRPHGKGSVLNIKYKGAHSLQVVSTH